MNQLVIKRYCMTFIDLDWVRSENAFIDACTFQLDDVDDLLEMSS